MTFRPTSLFTTLALAFLAAGSSVAQTRGAAPSGPQVVAFDSAQVTAPSSAAYQEWARKHAEWVRGMEQWERTYQKWLSEQSRLDDGLFISIGGGFSPTRVNTLLSGGNDVDFPDRPPYPEINLRGLGGTFDLRIGWLVKNDPYLKDYFFGNDELHDQLYLSLDVFGRWTPRTQLRFDQNDTANEGGFAHAAYSTDLMVGLGTTYILYPYLTSFSATIGLGLVAIQKLKTLDPDIDPRNIRTDIGPAVNFRVGQEWNVSENWKSGFAVHYGYIQAINRPREVNRISTYQETYHAHLFGLQWINTFTPPKYRRGAPPVRPQQWKVDAPER